MLSSFKVVPVQGAAVLAAHLPVIGSWIESASPVMAWIKTMVIMGCVVEVQVIELIAVHESFAVSSTAWSNVRKPELHGHLDMNVVHVFCIGVDPRKLLVRMVLGSHKREPDGSIVVLHNAVGMVFAIVLHIGAVRQDVVAHHGGLVHKRINRYGKTHL